jgi:hypothetical protein
VEDTQKERESYPDKAKLVLARLIAFPHIEISLTRSDFDDSTKQPTTSPLPRDAPEEA